MEVEVRKKYLNENYPYFGEIPSYQKQINRNLVQIWEGRGYRATQGSRGLIFPPLVEIQFEIKFDDLKKPYTADTLEDGYNKMRAKLDERIGQIIDGFKAEVPAETERLLVAHIIKVDMIVETAENGWLFTHEAAFAAEPIKYTTVIRTSGPIHPFTIVAPEVHREQIERRRHN